MAVVPECFAEALVSTKPPDLEALISKKEEKIKTSVLLDADVHAYFAQGGGIGQKINALCRWYMETKQAEAAKDKPKR